MYGAGREADGSQAAIGRGHPERLGKFGPTLGTVGGTAIIIRLNTEDIAFRSTARPGAGRMTDEDLIGLLIVLVSPVIGRAGAGEAVEGQVFQGKHILNHGAHFGTLNRTPPAQVFITRKTASNLTVMDIEIRHCSIGCLQISFFARLL